MAAYTLSAGVEASSPPSCAEAAEAGWGDLRDPFDFLDLVFFDWGEIFFFLVFAVLLFSTLTASGTQPSNAFSNPIGSYKGMK